jgi:Abnormal spindle-like microcephaly-assoc'd, ASPM-SPD-2-Hydin
MFKRTKNKMKRLALLFFLAFLPFFASLAFGQANVGVPVCGTATDGVTKYIPTDWATFTPPAKGVSYVDTRGGVPFGCRITRLTNGQTDFGSTTFGVTIYYDTAEPFSADDKLVMATQSGGAYYIIQNPYLTGQNGTAVPLANMPSMNNQAQPMWDRTQPELFYYTSGLQLRSATVTGTPGCFATFNCTITTALVHDFTGTYISLNMMDETSESVDGNHILMEGELPSTTQQVFVWNVSGASSSTPYNSTCTGSVSGPNGCLHKMQISGDNNPIILYNGTGGEFLWNGTSPVCLQGSCGGGSGETSHGATGQSVGGTALWISNAGPAVLASQPFNCPISNSTYQNISVVNANSPLSTTTCVLDATYPPGITNWHIGYDGSASQPWVFLTWFQEGPSFNFGNSGSYASPTSSNWPLYSGEFDLTRVNNSYTSLSNANVIRLAQTRNRSQPTFWAETFGALSFDGLYAVFSSNMAYGNVGCPSPIHASNECSDLYLVSAPSVSSFGTGGAPLFTSGSAPAVSFTPSSVNFGNVNVGSGATPINVTLQNTGTATLTMSAMTITGTNAGDFSFSTLPASTCGGSIAAAGTCTITFNFTPGAAGSRSATFNMTDNATGSPHTIALSGTGISSGAPGVSFSPPSVSFGLVPVLIAASPVNVVLTNTGTATLTISSMTISGTNAGDFSFSTLPASTCGGSIAAAGTCTITFNFTPGAVGSRSATFSMSDNASGSPHTIPLAGTGYVPANGVPTRLTSLM